MVMKQKTMSFKEVVACCLRQKALIKNTASVLPLWEEIWLFLHSSDCVPILAHALYLSLFSPLFISCSLSLSHTAVWWEDQGLQRGWITQSEYQQCCSVLVCQLSGRLFSLSLEPGLTAGGSKLTHGDQERKMIAVSVVQTFDICR